MKKFFNDLLQLEEKNGNLLIFNCVDDFLKDDFEFKKVWLDKYLNFGFFSENLIYFASGISNDHYLPVFFIREEEVNKLNNFSENINCRIISFVSGNSDLSILKNNQNFRVMTVESIENLGRLLNETYYLKEPIYIRCLTSFESELNLSQRDYFNADVLWQGEDILLLTYADHISSCMQLARGLEDRGISPLVISLNQLNPVPEEFLKRHIDLVRGVVLYEPSMRTNEFFKDFFVDFKKNYNGKEVMLRTSSGFLEEDIELIEQFWAGV